MSETTTRGRGRPVIYDADFVRDISLQVMIAYYNENPNALKDRIKKQENYVELMRARAVSFDDSTRHWLLALDSLEGESHKFYQRELMFRYWCQRLEPPFPLRNIGRKMARETALRQIIEKHLTTEYYRINCKRYLDAIQRVRTDSCLKLIQVNPHEITDPEDEYL